LPIFPYGRRGGDFFQSRPTLSFSKGPFAVAPAVQNEGTSPEIYKSKNAGVQSRLFAFFVIRLYRGRMTKKAGVFWIVTQGCGCCAA
jgi:hypothetical protein